MVDWILCAVVTFVGLAWAIGFLDFAAKAKAIKVSGMPLKSLSERNHQGLPSSRWPLCRFSKASPSPQAGSSGLVMILPPELVSHLLSTLPPASLLNAALTCKRLHRIAIPLLWRSPQVYSRIGASSSFPAEAYYRTWELHEITNIPRNFPIGRREYNRHVRMLDLSRGAGLVNDSTIRECAGTCEDLVRVVLKGCAAVTDIGIGFLAAADCVKRLESVDIERCAGVTDAGVVGLLERAKKLKSIGLKDNASISDETLDKLAMHGRGITELILAGCDGVTSKGVMKFVESHGGSLRLLDISRTKCITVDVIAAIAVHCKGLEKLDLSVGSDDTPSEAAKDALATLPPSLRELGLSNHAYLTDDILSCLVARMKDLKDLDVSGCLLLTKACLKRFEGLESLTMELDDDWDADDGVDLADEAAVTDEKESSGGERIDI